MFETLVCFHFFVFRTNFLTADKLQSELSARTWSGVYRISKVTFDFNYLKPSNIYLCDCNINVINFQLMWFNVKFKHNFYKHNSFLLTIHSEDWIDKYISYDTPISMGLLIIFVDCKLKMAQTFCFSWTVN